MEALASVYIGSSLLLINWILQVIPLTFLPDFLYGRMVLIIDMALVMELDPT